MQTDSLKTQLLILSRASVSSKTRNRSQVAASLNSSSRSDHLRIQCAAWCRQPRSRLDVATIHTLRGAADLIVHVPSIVRVPVFRTRACIHFAEIVCGCSPNCRPLVRTTTTVVACTMSRCRSTPVAFTGRLPRSAPWIVNLAGRSHASSSTLPPDASSDSWPPGSMRHGFLERVSLRAGNGRHRQDQRQKTRERIRLRRHQTCLQRSTTACPAVTIDEIEGAFRSWRQAS